MNIVGFDVAKDSIIGVRIDRSGVVKERWQLANTKETVAPVLAALKKRFKHLQVAAEATGDCHRVLALCCLELDVPFRLLNPLSVKRYIRATVRKLKTDKTDAEAIARVALQGEGTTVTSDLLAPSKLLLRMSLRLQAHVRTVARIEQRLDGGLVTEQPQLAEALQATQKELLAASKVFQCVATALCDQEQLRLLRSVPGVGTTLAPVFLLEIGAITRFRSPKALVAYAGLDPKTLQSGTTLNRHGRLTKRGSPHLRWAAFIAATVARQYDPVCKALFEKKRSEGKRYTEATIIVAQKLLRIIYAVWTSGKPYEVRT